MSVTTTLSQFTENFITAIYKATSQAETSNILDNFLFRDAHITVNGKNISRTDFLKELQTEKFLEQGAEVKFLDIVEVSANKEAPNAAGSVGTFFTVIIEEKIRLRDAPLSHKVTASLNVHIEQDPSIPIRPIPFIDQRRAKELNLVILDTPVPIIPPIVPPVPTGN